MQAAGVILRDAAGVLVALLAGGVVGACVGALWAALNLPVRLLHIFALENTRLCGWALCLGALLSTALDLMGLSLHLGDMAGILAMACGGVFVGMLASALTEVLDVIPRGLSTLRLQGQMKAMGWALALGKMLGAFCASYWRLWG